MILSVTTACWLALCPKSGKEDWNLQVTTLNEVLELASAETTGRVGELERPEEVGSLFEVGANGVDLVDKIFHADDTILPEA